MYSGVIECLRGRAGDSFRASGDGRANVGEIRAARSNRVRGPGGRPDH